MVSKKIEKALQGSSAIRAMFNEGKEMAALYGAENVYDFSLGNPATPAPEKVNEAIKQAVDELNPLELHGYMSNAGYEDVRKAMADNLNGRFGTDFTEKNIVMTVGAAGGLNIIFKTLLDPGDEVVVFAPYFGEYRAYAANFDAVIVEVAPDFESFQPDLQEFEKKLTAKTKVVLVNTPNNPTGVVYSEDTMKQIAAILEKKEKEYGHEIYLVSDEPYRELVYDDVQELFLTKYYRNTIVGYSFSKSLSLPGERIGYVAVPNEVVDAQKILDGLEVSNRTLGFVNAPSLIQKAAAAAVEEKTDVDFYDRNRKLLYEGLTKLGFCCVKPQGAFYLWMKSPDEDEERFVENAKKYHIILVKGSAFACPGYVRMAYCVSSDMIQKSLPEFEKLAREYGLKNE
ncbi:MAG: pyridoxal phosphate-dependent aminotransferase [Lachnospiraceae bacterium]|nr:pyridoxal phosphate-dependent aminotransferase [Lachnospiraceae bacterium]MDD7378748.1 pyridoxal phosphate-dependent aminotransferase [Lachnospiraceae bacterium]MDY4617835.1 pyridoxal phosphate-dependent aminotransferase [Lachnospiraceae bacterium]